VKYSLQDVWMKQLKEPEIDVERLLLYKVY